MPEILVRRDPLIGDEPGLSFVVILVVILLVSLTMNVVMYSRCREYLKVMDERPACGEFQ